MANENFLMPLDWDALMTDPNVVSMNDKEFRAYMNLLWTAWNQPMVGTLPDDEAKLAAFSRINSTDWQACKVSILACFQLKGGRWHQKKMREIHRKVLHNRKVNRERARKAANNRWHSSKHAPSMRGVKAEDASQSQSQIQELLHTHKAPYPEAEWPTPKDWMAYCELIGLPNWKAEMEYLNQERKHWEGVRNWQKHANFILNLWRNQGAHSEPPQRWPKKSGKKGESVWEKTKRRELLEKEIANHPATDKPGGFASPTDEERRELRELKQKLDKLNREIMENNDE
jgi:uncharacterized protein YdaU (DUF1376 family)